MQPRPGFELTLPVLYSISITITLSAFPWNSSRISSIYINPQSSNAYIFPHKTSVSSSPYLFVTSLMRSLDRFHGHPLRLLLVKSFYTYIYSRPTVVEGDPKSPFSIVTTPRCRERCYSFPCIAPHTLDPYIIILSVKQVPFFESLVWLDLELNFDLLDHWRTVKQLWHWAGWIYMYIYMLLRIFLIKA